MKRILSFVLVLVFVLGVSNVTTGKAASDEPSSGDVPTQQLGDLLFIEENDGVTITGYTGPGGAVTIPGEISGKPVTAIGDEAFARCDKITSISMPENLISIGHRAFMSCDGILSIIIPEGVQTIGDSAFFLSYNLMSVTIPNSVLSIGFAAFSGCKNLTSVTLSNQLTSISSYLFNECYKLSNIIIPNSVVTIESGAFSNCRGLGSITIPAGVKHIEPMVFDQCHSLMDIFVDEDNGYYSSLDGVLLNKERTALACYPSGRQGEYSIPDGVVKVSDTAFFGCLVSSLRIPPSVISIEILEEGLLKGMLYNFNSCVKLTDIIVDEKNPVFSSSDGVLFDKEQKKLIRHPIGKTGSYIMLDSVVQLERNAFEDCAGLTSITLSDNLEEYGGLLLNRCINLSEINANETSVHYSSIDGVLFNKEKTTLIIYPVGKSASNSYHIPEGVVNVEIDAFFQCNFLNSIFVPKSVENLENNTFRLSGLQRIEVDPDNAYYSSIGGVLTNKDKTLLITYPQKRIGPYFIPKGIDEIGEMAFYNCWQLTQITIPAGATTIGEYAFANCFNLESAFVPDSVVSFGDNAFGGCDANKLVFYATQNPSAQTQAQGYGFQFVTVDPNPADLVDVPWAVQAIGTAINQGLMSVSYDQNGRCSFRPTESATRAEFAAALFKLFEFAPGEKSAFEDGQSHWAADYIAKLAELGIMQGISPTQFAPDDPITREQIATILSRALKPTASPTDFRYTDDAAISHWARDSVYAAHAAGWISGDDAGSFRPSDTATRAEVAVIFARLVQAKETL